MSYGLRTFVEMRPQKSLANLSFYHCHHLDYDGTYVHDNSQHLG